MTTWDKIVSGKDLVSAKFYRRRTYVTKKERALALPDLVEEGWKWSKNYKNPKFISVRKEKPYDELFEDKVWMLFANMGFTHMNKDRFFKMQYDFHNSDITQQIDVFAADEETVLIIECKSASELKNGFFKKPIEALYGQMNGLRKEAQKKFPKRKVKFIWATNNYIMSKADLDKLKEWDIAYFSDSIVNYYIELVKHLGSCARYQLLGNLFANQEIRNMDNRIPAIEGKMGKHKYYSFSIEPEKLLKIGYVLHRNEANKSMMPTYQRLIKKKRLQDVQRFIENGGYFPNSLIISIETNGRGLQFDAVSKQSHVSAISRLGILHLPKKYRSAYIIDGQHRLYGYSDSEYAYKNSIPVVAFVDLGREEQIKIFMDINENQKAVPKTLRVTLNADMLWASDNYNERRQALRSKIAQMLGEEESSPLFGRIAIGENEKNSVRCITVEALQGALRKCQFFSMYNNKNEIITEGTFDLGENQPTCDLFYVFIEQCLDYCKMHLENEWNKGDSGILTINRGMQGLIRVINDIVNHLISDQMINPKNMSMDILIDLLKYYLDPLIEFIGNISNEKRSELKVALGGGADKKYWRMFQKSISDARKEFNPEGLQEYWRDEAKTFNNESGELLRDVTLKIKELIKNKLQDYYGEQWLINGLHKTIYQRAKKEADDHNYEVKKNGIGGDEISIWDCINLSDCISISTNYGRHWSDLFERIFVREEDKYLVGGKSAKIQWMNRLSKIEKNINKITYSVSKDDYDLLKNTYEWLVLGKT